MRIESFLRQSPIVQASRAARKMDAALNALLAEQGLTVLEALVLTAIFFEKPGAIKPSQLAVAFEMTRGGVSHCLASLEAKGLVRRRIDPEDARAFQLLLLPTGRRRAARVAGILDRMQRQLETALGVARLDATIAGLCAVESVCLEMASEAR